MKKILRAVLVCALSVCAALPAHAAARSEGIAVVVNEDAVSVSDINDRMKLIMVSSGMPDTPDMRQKMEPQIVSTLIEERLMMQEAGRLGITVPPEEIEKGFATIAQQNNLTSDQFKAVLSRGGIAMRTLERQIESQMAWSQVIQVKLRPQVTITESQVDSKLKEMETSIGSTRYLLAEIFLPVGKPAEEDNVKQLANRLVHEMAANRIPFQKLASQFSQAAGAARGGDMGWVQQGQLPEDIEKAVEGMKEGDLSQPIRSRTGYHILLLRKKSVLTQETLPPRDDIMSRIGVEQLERMQRRLLLDLKSDAFIEHRA